LTIQINIKKVIIGNLWWVIPVILIYIAQKTNIINDIHGIKLRSIGYLIIATGFFQAGFYNLSQFKIGVRKGLNVAARFLENGRLLFKLISQQTFCQDKIILT
jgi:hypothetical protein